MCHAALATSNAAWFVLYKSRALQAENGAQVTLCWFIRGFQRIKLGTLIPLFWHETTAQFLAFVPIIATEPNLIK
jgi:hypothetical protein